LSHDIELLGERPPGAPSDDRARELIAAALRAAGVADGHVALEYVDPDRIVELNAAHRSLHEPTDVLSFPIDEAGEAVGPRELGDIVICPQHTADLAEAIVHGALHLAGLDHETDDGEMLALQAQILRDVR